MEFWFCSVAENQETFQPPPVPPPSHKWEQDSQVLKCRVCKGIFGLVSITPCIK